MVKGKSMLGIRHEEYHHFTDGLPFLLHININRNNVNYSKESNWHENLEIQLCEEGQGYVLLNAERYEIEKNDIVVANSDVIHYTGAETEMTYSCLIISTEFCRNIGLVPQSVLFEPVIKSEILKNLFIELKKLYVDSSAPYRTAKMNKLVIELLIELAEHYGTATPVCEIDTAKSKIIKLVILYTRQNYNRKITLDEIAGAALYDKYALCREFKKYTGQTITEYLNYYRCVKAKELLEEGYSVTETADLCGFGNLSYFGKTFKRHIGYPPSKDAKLRKQV